MRGKFLLLCLFLAVAVSGYAQKQVSAADSLELKEISYDFGKISQGKPVTHVFEVVNRGKQPLKLQNVQASCGCTTPEWNTNPIASGATGYIKVGFNAASEGDFTKTITITYNNNQQRAISITGEVYPSPATSAPLNPSLSVINQINQ